MAVYNTENYVHDAIQSVLSQPYSNFEFIIIDDFSIDNTSKIVMEFDDPRIVFIQNTKNLGLAASLNKALDMACGKYIARMDSDDICLKDRFIKQIGFLEKNDQIDICGGFVSRIDKNGKIFKSLSRVPIDDKYIKANTVFNPQFFHPTIVFRTSFIRRHHVRYNTLYKKSQDFELWSRLMRKGNCKMANISSIVLRYRDLKDKNEKRKRNYVQTKVANSIRLKNLRELGVPYIQSHNIINRFINGQSLTKPDFFRLVILLKNINKIVYRRFGVYPKLNQLFPLSFLKLFGIFFFVREGLFRSLVFLKIVKQFGLTILNKDRSV
jgi:glycosyltransferase involved in cell wall biosynthesis